LDIEPNNVLVVAEDTQNPVIPKLLKMGCALQSASLEEDLAVCVQAKHFIAGFGTFAPLAIFLGRHQSVHLPNPFLPEHDRMYSARGLPSHVKVYEFSNYLTQFHNEPHECEIMLTWNDSIHCCN
jgi:hypothetical protein